MHMESNCCGAAPTGCDSAIAELPRYYPRQLITPDDLTLEQNYFRDRMRRHNRLLHGWGVVCGALVCPVPNPHPEKSSDLYLPWLVQVERGYVLGPYGDEIVLDCTRTVDVRTSGVSGVTGEPCIDKPDPWCTPVFVNPDDTTTYYIAIKYTQAMTRPVRVQPAGCGCDDTSCEYSRWKDGYDIGVLRELHPCPQEPRGRNRTGNPDLSLLVQGADPACPDCSCGPWVCLATVTVDVDGNIKAIDNCACRRLVMSFSQFWWACTGLQPVIGNVEPSTLQGGRTVAVTVTGKNFQCGASAAFDTEPTAPTVQQVVVKDPQTLILAVTVPSVTVPTRTHLTVTNMDGTRSAPSGYVTIDRGTSSGRGGGGMGSPGPNMKASGRGQKPRTVKRTP
jgi:hypothetical protein